MSNIVIPLLQYLKTGDTIAIQADTGLYFSRVANKENSIKAAKTSIDEDAKFKVTVIANNQIALQADTGLYLSRINRGNIDPIEAAKGSIDVFSIFTLTSFDNGLISLRADNGRYLSRINYDGKIDGDNPIEAAKGDIDVFCQFKIIRL
jgi:hypothetical protein